MRDAQGNVMAVYTHTESDTATFELTEQHIYGSSRIGMVKTNIDMLVTFTEDNYFYRSLGEKRYELSNHLGNVLSVISDRRLAFDTDANGTTNYYEADVMSAQDYDPFGMLLVGRSWEGGSEYGYGFQGFISDNEIYKNNCGYSTYFRQYDPRLGRWFSVDPKFKDAPWQSHYNSMSNSPITNVDSDGDKDVYYSADGRWSHTVKYNFFYELVHKNRIYIPYDKGGYIQVSRDYFFNVFQVEAPQPYHDMLSEWHPSTFQEVELWLEEPSESYGTAAAKIVAGIGYDVINSPKILLTHKTLGGFETTPDDRVDAFASVASEVLFAGSSKAANLVEVKGGTKFAKFNDYSKKTAGQFKSTPLEHHSTARGNSFKINEVNLKTMEQANDALDIIYDGLDATEKITNTNNTEK